MEKKMLTVESVRSALDYDPETGVFRWRVSRQRVRKGKAAGFTTPQGYVRICLGGKVYSAHRLAWFYVYGVWPDGEMDHINRDKADNRIANLRPATKAQNMANSVTRGKSGRRGVARTRNGKRWKAQITVDGRTRHLGTFDDREDAVFAYAVAAAKHFADFAVLEI